jgi:hypothetical protein
MTTLIKVLGLGSFEVYEDETWVRSYEPDGGGGRGDVVLTHDRALAARYIDVGHAMRVWRAQSTTHPWRSDGKANRPLTAFSVEFENVDEVGVG